MSRTPKVLIIEDQELQRTSLHQFLERLNFEVHSAGKVAEGRELLEHHGDDADVIVFDMLLEDPEYPGVLGVDLGFELRQRLRHDGPEFLIFSAYAELEYCQKALRLGAASYLRKPQKIRDMVHHIRALVLRRRLAAELSAEPSRIERIAEISHSKKASQLRWCREVFEPHLRAALDDDYFLLFSDSEGTVTPGGSREDLEGVSPQLLESVASLAFGNSNMDKPFILEEALLSQLLQQEEMTRAPELEDVALTTLAETRDFKLLLGIFPRSEDKQRCRRASIVARYCRTVVTNNLMEVAARWTALQSHRKALLAATSRFCLRIGERQGAILRATEEHGAIHCGALSKFKELEDELYKAGSLFADLYEEETGDSTTPEGVVHLHSVVRTVWLSLAKESGLQTDLLDIEQGDLTVEGDSENLRFVVFTILQWLLTRLRKTKDRSHPIRVRFEKIADTPCLAFEDSSRRMPTALRHQLFLPFSEVKSFQNLPEGVGSKYGKLFNLFTAKTLMEIRNHGYIEDQTDQLVGDTGHRFVLGFPTL